MSEKKLIDNVNEVKPSATSNMVNAELYELITKKKYETNFSFNMMKIYKEGLVQKQTHCEQHGVFILSGKCNILLGEEWIVAKKNDYIYIPSNLQHAFSNNNNELAKILILKL